ncbi:MAG: sigma-70 family RNA polymerase sigma factor [Actinobacteria bacterium]|nr:sigma-70 family RNA polymerase sigma factor [Actinomycetota bacterium]
MLEIKVTQEHVDRAFRIAHWYGRRARRAEISDLESAALEGLAKAARDWEPEPAPSRELRRRRKRSFWSFAFIRILGEMKDELRRFDHLTRDQRAMVAEQANGDLALDQQELSWINPEAPMALDAVVCVEGENPRSIVDLVEEPRDAIEEFELRDAFCRAGAALPEQQKFVVVKREIEGFTNTELADAFDVTEGRASQIRGAALDQMREQIADSFLDAA